MNIQVPGKMSRQEGPPGEQSRENARARRRFHDELDVAKRPGLMVEDDLNHLGSVHKSAR